jgi:hypothetical protein
MRPKARLRVSENEGCDMGVDRKSMGVSRASSVAEAEGKSLSTSRR